MASQLCVAFSRIWSMAAMKVKVWIVTSKARVVK